MTKDTITTITIAGANGTMGSLFRDKFTEIGCRVTGLDLPYTEEAIRDALADCQLLLLCVPVTAMGDVVDRFKPHMLDSTILADVGSVKVGPMKAMTERHDGPVVGTHPLFGNVIPEDFAPRVAVAPGRERDDQAAQQVCQLFADCGYESFMTTADEHDRAMAFVQGLNFTSTVAFLAATRDIPSIKNFVTPSFKRRLDSAHKMLTVDMELFETISEANPYLQETNRKFMTYLSLAAGGDLELLTNRAQWWWDPSIR
ncbi:Prephenate dehydrogenase [Pseudodesulfovibrio profundus]|uniref:Prephenate dehydrogenase n=1 Tax=Pseudodesulfovibrio profundus TaxID=57320 RepID=A0A2C8FAT6_9BACT|nr:prephenate dehydrogenase/arogenate dehydrogenase family protein [Pseudodesulfovibrio profundus]SOB59756.1 Prephenate dehydrogenase [Pseudodesulfovibrio profundus]